MLLDSNVEEYESTELKGTRFQDKVREQMVKNLGALREMKRRFVKMLDGKSPESDSVELKNKIANLDRIIDKCLMQLDDWDRGNRGS